jgi:hypothetical protein
VAGSAPGSSCWTIQLSSVQTATLSGFTSVYLQGIDNVEIVETVHARRADDPRQRHHAALSASQGCRRSSRIAGVCKAWLDPDRL